MKISCLAGAVALAFSTWSSAQTFTAGEPLATVNEAGEATPMSSNVKVFGSFRFAESCTFDPERNLILAMNAGVPQAMEENDGYVSLINPDGSVHTAKWIGNSRDGLTLNQPLGSAVHDGVLYVADTATVRTFDLASGQPIAAHSAASAGANGLNGIAVAEDGTIYASNTRDPQRVYRIPPDGEASVFIDGSPLMLPNGVAVDNDGNIVVVNIGNNHVMTFNTDSDLVNTEFAAESGNDGIVVTEDGTKYVSSVRYGSISKIVPGEEAEVIAVGIPSAASICYDSVQNQIVIPMNNNNALGFLPLD
ncbi:gluconolaconase [Pseudohongiella acticola]|jgi:sugar lactone lactonase YvrE|uniref:Gluconolaconase n=1 Tax=Pseudohongiella acticola TaxID=1524254 RepID=A0A1E8CLR4_9GAMM|nr:SMP-30/gluconolactonase/LRE family protein [Pseudohongiella acticola]OFE13235.1 gluconolaconase [Pseudohongiella acticola]